MIILDSGLLFLGHPVYKLERVKMTTYKYVCITANQPQNISNPIPNPTTKPHAVGRIRLNVLLSLTAAIGVVHNCVQFIYLIWKSYKSTQ